MFILGERDYIHVHMYIHLSVCLYTLSCFMTCFVASDLCTMQKAHRQLRPQKANMEGQTCTRAG